MPQKITKRIKGFWVSTPWSSPASRPYNSQSTSPTFPSSIWPCCNTPLYSFFSQPVEKKTQVPDKRLGTPHHSSRTNVYQSSKQSQPWAYHLELLKTAKKPEWLQAAVLRVSGCLSIAKYSPIYVALTAHWATLLTEVAGVSYKRGQRGCLIGPQLAPHDPSWLRKHVLGTRVIEMGWETEAYKIVAARHEDADTDTDTDIVDGCTDWHGRYEQ